MSSVAYLNPEDFKGACPDADMNDAIMIAAKFCNITFGEIECRRNAREVSTFCASILAEAQFKKIKSKADKKLRPFNVKDDFHNELKTACQNNEHPIAIVSSRLLQLPEKMGASVVSLDREDAIHGHDNGKYDDTAWHAQLLSIFKDYEKDILSHMNSVPEAYEIAKAFQLEMPIAKEVARQIREKIAIIEEMGSFEQLTPAG